MSVIIRGLELPATCSQCDFKAYDADRIWFDSNGKTQGAYVCHFTGDLIRNTKRNEICPLEDAPKEEE